MPHDEKNLGHAKIIINDATKKILRRDVDGSIKRAVDKAIRLFADNPLHPSLNFEKYNSLENTYSIRATLHVRIYLTEIDDKMTMQIVKIGNHDYLRRL